MKLLSRLGVFNIFILLSLFTGTGCSTYSLFGYDEKGMSLAEKKDERKRILEESEEIKKNIIKYTPQSIITRLEHMVYIQKNQVGFEFFSRIIETKNEANEEENDEENENKEVVKELLCNIYRFDIDQELPVKGKSDIPVTLVSQKSEGTWIMELEGHSYILNETDMLLTCDTHERIYPQKIHFPEEVRNPVLSPEVIAALAQEKKEEEEAKQALVDAEKKAKDEIANTDNTLTEKSEGTPELEKTEEETKSPEEKSEEAPEPEKKESE